MVDSPNFEDTITSISTIPNSFMSHSVPVSKMEDIMNVSDISEVESDL